MKHGYGQALTFTKICHKVKGWDDSLAVWTEKKTSKKKSSGCTWPWLCEWETNNMGWTKATQH